LYFNISQVSSGCYNRFKNGTFRVLFIYDRYMFVLTCIKSQKDERKFACIEAKMKL